VGPLQFSNNCNYIFTIIDHTPKWMEAIPLAIIAAADCERTLVFFGLPTTITSDHDLQFSSSLWAALCEMLSITPPDHSLPPRGEKTAPPPQRRIACKGRCDNLG
jgi:hypothetical protein